VARGGHVSQTERNEDGWEWQNAKGKGKQKGTVGGGWGQKFQERETYVLMEQNRKTQSGLPGKRGLRQGRGKEKAPERLNKNQSGTSSNRRKVFTVEHSEREESPSGGGGGKSGFKIIPQPGCRQSDGRGKGLGASPRKSNAKAYLQTEKRDVRKAILLNLKEKARLFLSKLFNLT